MAKVVGFDHVSILVKDADASLDFYQNLLGVGLLERPELGFPGYWVDLYQGQSLHIMQLDNPYNEVQKPEHGGRDFHFALRVDDISAFAEKLDVMGMEYNMSKSGRRALFTHDLDGNTLELFEFVKA